MSKWSKFPLEAVIWFCGLVALAFIDPSIPRESICPLHNLGFEFCPGCGLGRSVSYFLHGEFEKSWTTHPLGIAAVFLLTFRTVKLTKTFFLYGSNY